MAFQQISGTRTTWINLVRPTKADAETLRRLYPYFHPLNIEDILSPDERPKIDDQDEYLFVVMQFPIYDARTRLSRPYEINFFVGRGFVITAHDGVLSLLDDLFRDCRDEDAVRAQMLGSSAGHTFYVIVDKLVDHVFPILRKVDGNIRGIEEILFSNDDRRLIRDITLVRRDIIALRRIIRQQVPILENLERVERVVIHEDLEDYFGDILDHLYRARDIIDEDSEIIASLASTADSLLNHKINSVIRILTVFSVIMLPLTFISSVYGMNVDLPFDDHPNAFLLVMCMMVAIGALMLLLFRRRRWL